MSQGRVDMDILDSAAAAWSDVGCLREDQAGGGALPIVFDSERRMSAVHSRGCPRERSHGDAIGNLDRANRGGGEQSAPFGFVIA